MQKLKLPLINFLPLVLIVFSFSCVRQDRESQKDLVVVREMADASNLNPVFFSSELDHIIGLQIFQTLIGIDYPTEELVGVLAVSPAEETKDSTGNSVFHYEIRKEATFDNGRPILAEDVLFSLKLNLLPTYSQVGNLNYYSFIKDFKINPKNPRKFSIHCRNANKRNRYASGDFAILPWHLYDSNRLLKNFSLHELLHNDSLAHHKQLKQFAASFESNNFSMNEKYINGSGPYQLKKWEKGQFILLEKKDDWWGETLDDPIFFRANMPMIRYEIINDPVSALTALKGNNVELMRSIPAKDFMELSKNPAAQEKLIMKSKPIHAYQYIGFNHSNKFLQSRSLRKAIAHTIPKQEIIRLVYYDQAEAIYGPFSPLRKFFNPDLVDNLSYDPDKSRQILAENQYFDSDNDGLLETIVENDTLPLRLSYHYNAGNEQRKAVGIILREELKKIGIELQVKSLEWSVYLQGLRNGDFELFYGGVVSMPNSYNFIHLLHSSSAFGGRNYANYQNKKTDMILDQLEKSKQAEAESELIGQLIKQVHQDVPYYFLFTPKENLAHSKLLKNVNIYSIRPHYWAPEISKE